MAITVGEVADIPDFRTRVLSGRAGLDRDIAWAHVCELPDPTEWLGDGELLMTVGYPIPEDPQDQELFVERLAEARISGLLICDQAYAPRVTEKLRGAADRHALPVLLTAYEVPFTTIARTVAEANRSTEYTRFLQVLRVYETVRLALGNTSGTDLLTRLGTMLDCDLFVLDLASGYSLLPDHHQAPAELSAALAEEMAGRTAPIPAILRLPASTRAAAAFLVPASRPAALVAATRGSDLPDLSIVHHVTAVATLEVERLIAEFERRRLLGSELLAGLVDSRLTADPPAHPMTAYPATGRGLVEESAVLACCACEGETAEHSDLHVRLELRGVPHLLLRRGGILTAFLPDAPESISAFREEIDARYPIGLSDPIGNLARVLDAHREAQWALRGGQATGDPVSRYGRSAAPSPFLPRNLSEAQSVVRQVLGPLIDYDAAHESRLVESLRTFLAHNRSWRTAAESLSVHKQTLVYRMRRVTQITGRRLDRTQDVAELWLALRAAEAAGVDRRGDS